jgi:aldose 1-epimerase
VHSRRRSLTPIRKAIPRAGTVTLAAGSNRVVLDPARGGRIASWTVDDVELLLGPPDDADSSIRWGCFVMAPWPGRLAGGRFEWRGGTIEVPRTWGRHAIHGLTWNRRWSVTQATSVSATLEVELPAEAWPMGGRVREHISVSPAGVRLEAVIEAGREPMPAALGWHPWFLRRGDPRLRLDAPRFQVADGMVPTGATARVVGRTDLRTGPPLGRRRLDLGYLDARPPARVTWPDLELEIAFAPSPAPVVVYTPRDVFCVEPLTASPNALTLPSTARAAAGVVDLAAGERLTASMTLTVTR